MISYGVIVGLAHRHSIQVQFDASIALRGHLEAGRGQARRPHVLDRDDRILLHQLQAGFDQELLAERVADLHSRALLVAVVLSENSADAIVAP